MTGTRCDHSHSDRPARGHLIGSPADQSAPAVLAMTVRVGATGIDVAEAEHAGQLYRATSRHGATMALARMLVAAGAADTAWQALDAGGAVRVYGASLHRLARLTVHEEDTRGLRFRGWEPPPAAIPRGARVATGLAMPAGTGGAGTAAGGAGAAGRNGVRLFETSHKHGGLIAG